MLSYQTYKIVHLLGIFLILMSLGALSFYLMNGGRGKPGKQRQLAIAHGIGMLLALVGGFGMLARLGIHWPWPGWILGKIGVWFLLGGMLGVIPRRPQQAAGLWWAVAGLGATAAWLAIQKPF